MSGKQPNWPLKITTEVHFMGFYMDRTKHHRPYKGPWSWGCNNTWRHHLDRTLHGPYRPWRTVQTPVKGQSLDLEKCNFEETQYGPWRWIQPVHYLVKKGISGFWMVMFAGDLYGPWTSPWVIDPFVLMTWKFSEILGAHHGPFHGPWTMPMEHCNNSSFCTLFIPTFQLPGYYIMCAYVLPSPDPTLWEFSGYVVVVKLAHK